MYHLPLPSRDPVYPFYPLEDDEAGALAAAHRQYREILARPRNALPAEVRRELVDALPGLLPEVVHQPEGELS
jgi:hypothetical protein